MKKLLSLLLVLLLVLTACSSNGDSPEPTEPEQQETEGSDEETGSETEEETPAATGVAKIGLGTDVSLAKSTAFEDGEATAQEDTTVVAATFDADGKIVDVIIDVAQNKAKLAEGAEIADVDGRSKKELKDDYGMRKASEIGKEWFEQAEALEQAWIGKTAEEALAMELTEGGAIAELSSSVTIKVAGYQTALKNAWENAVDAEGIEKLGLGLVSHLGSKTSAATADEGANVQFETYMAAVGLDADGKIAEVLINVAQNAVGYNVDGTLAEGFSEVGTTKKDRGEDYGMRKASGIGKEWFEQIASLEDYMVGKTLEEIKGIPVEQRDESHVAVPSGEDLKSSVTITIDGYQGVVEEAINNAR